jgi:hypothetical protein
MNKPKHIPVTAAKQISQQYNYPEVIVFAYDPVTGKQHLTTYGATKAQCADAAKAADFLKQTLKWPSHTKDG